MCSLVRAFTALAHAQNGRTYGNFFQSMLRRDLVCMQSCQSLHCSRTYTKWVCFGHILSVNVQTNLSMRAVSPDPSLLSHMHRKGVHTVYFISQCSDAHEHLCSFARAFTAFAHAQNGCTYGIFLVNAQTRLSMRTVSSEPLLLAHWQNGCSQRIRPKSVHVYRSNLGTYYICINIIHV